MKRRFRYIVTAGLTGLIFAACSDNGRVVDGTVETTNGFAVRSDGTPAVNARIYLVTQRDWLIRTAGGQSVILDSAVTDDQGVFQFPETHCAPCNLEVSTPDEGLMAFDFEVDANGVPERDTFNLAPKAAYSASLTGGSLPGRLLLAGTRYTASLQGGAYAFASLPVQSYLLLSEAAGLTAHRIINPALSAQDAIPVSSETIIPLEDFDARGNRSATGFLLGGGWWRMMADGAQGGTSALVNPVDAAPLNFAGAIMEDDGMHNGPFLQVDYILGMPGAEKPYAMVYAELNLGTAHYNLASMDSLVFRSRGNGQLRVEFIQQPTGTELTVEASAAVGLNDTVLSYRVLPSSFSVEGFGFPADMSAVQPALSAAHLPLYQAPPASWQETGGVIKSIRFTAVSGTFFTLDDITLYGVPLSELLTYTY